MFHFIASEFGELELLYGGLRRQHDVGRFGIFRNFDWRVLVDAVDPGLGSVLSLGI